MQRVLVGRMDRTGSGRDRGASSGSWRGAGGEWSSELEVSSSLPVGCSVTSSALRWSFISSPLAKTCSEYGKGNEACWMHASRGRAEGAREQGTLLRHPILHLMSASSWTPTTRAVQLEAGLAARPRMKGPSTAEGLVRGIGRSLIPPGPGPISSPDDMSLRRVTGPGAGRTAVLGDGSYSPLRSPSKTRPHKHAC